MLFIPGKKNSKVEKKDMQEVAGFKLIEVDLTRCMDECKDLNSRMRTILVEWIAELNLVLHFSSLTFFTSIELIDTFLCLRKDVLRSKFQLLGITCVLIANKMVEDYPCEENDLIKLCDNAYRVEDLKEFERVVCETLDYNFSFSKIRNVLDCCENAEFNFYLTMTRFHESFNSILGEEILIICEDMMREKKLDDNFLKCIQLVPQQYAKQYFDFANKRGCNIPQATFQNFFIEE